METVAQLAPLEDACTVVIVRDGEAGLETLMLERPATSRSFGGVWVFPGGKVDPEDRLDTAGTAVDDLAAARAAGLRELAEETGQALGVEELVWLSQWTPRQAIPRRFRTWFMLAPASPEPIVLNPDEHERFTWLAPSRVLELHAKGDMKLVPPTWVTLHNLDGAASVEQAISDAKARAVFAYNTHLLVPSGGNQPDGVLWAGDEAYPDQAGGGTVPGARHRLTTKSLPWVFERTLL